MLRAAFPIDIALSNLKVQTGKGIPPVVSSIAENKKPPLGEEALMLITL
jgi:hypothetical protein